MNVVSIWPSGRLFLQKVDEELIETPRRGEDITSQTSIFLTLPCFIEPDVTLADVFLIIRNDPVIQHYFSSYPINALLDDAFDDATSRQERQENIEFLEIRQAWEFDSQKRFYYPHHRPDLRAASPVLVEDCIDESGICLGSKGERAYWSVTCSSPGSWRATPLRINEYAEIYEAAPDLPSSHRISEVVRHPWLMLSQVLHAIVHEFSMFGAGDDRERFVARIKCAYQQEGE